MQNICLTVITRNEARCIERCLISAAPFVDRIVVLDTGSDDDTMTLASKCGATVHQMEWTNSFSDARNRCLEIASADWCLVLDADEWIDPSMSRDTLNKHITNSLSAGAILVRNSFNMLGRCEMADCWIPRLIPGSTRYKGIIHEQPQTIGPDIRLDFLVHHDGYTIDRSRGKQVRNFELLREALDENPLNPYFHFQMGVQHEITNEWKEASRHFANSISLGGGNQAYSHGLYCRSIHVLTRIGQSEDALKMALYAETRWPDSSDIQFAIGNVYLDLAQMKPSEAVRIWLPAAEAAWLKCLEIGDLIQYQDHVLGRGGHLAAYNLSVLYSGIGNSSLAKKYGDIARMLASAYEPKATGLEAKRDHMGRSFSRSVKPKTSSIIF